MYYNCLILYCNGGGKKKVNGKCFHSNCWAFCPVRKLWVREQGWDDHHEWLNVEGAGLLFLSLVVKEPFDKHAGTTAWTQKRRGWQMVHQDGESVGRWRGLFEQQRHFWLPTWRVGKREEDNLPNAASMYTENVLAERRLTKDIQLLAARKAESCC